MVCQAHIRDAAVALFEEIPRLSAQQMLISGHAGPCCESGVRTVE